MAEDAADRLVARAIESVLDQVPGMVDTTVPEAASAKLQPWAETAAPVGRNKRPLEELLHELAARVAADPGAQASLPSARHPALAFFDRFGRAGAGQRGSERPGDAAAGSGGRSRRRRRRGGSAGPAPGTPPAPVAPASGSERAPGGRRRRRGRGSGGSAAPNSAAAGAPGTQPAAGQPRAPGAGRRRRGRRGRGGGGGERPAGA